MQKWEYLETHIASATFDKFSHKVWSVNGQELPNWKRGPHYIQYFNILGDQGWEMVSEGEWFQNTFVCHFKRPKPY